MNENKSDRGGVGVVGLLGVAFVILKLTHVIDWKWVWVLTPFWAVLVPVLLVLLIPLIAYVVAKLFGKR